MRHGAWKRTDWKQTKEKKRRKWKGKEEGEGRGEDNGL